MFTFLKIGISVRNYCSDFNKKYTLRCAFLLLIQCTLIYFIISSGLEINSNKPFCLQNDGEIQFLHNRKVPRYSDRESNPRYWAQRQGCNQLSYTATLRWKLILYRVFFLALHIARVYGKTEVTAIFMKIGILIDLCMLIKSLYGLKVVGPTVWPTEVTKVHICHFHYFRLPL